MSVNLQYDDDKETAGEVLISIQPVYQGRVTSLKHQITVAFGYLRNLQFLHFDATFLVAFVIVRAQRESMISTVIHSCVNCH